MPHVIHAELAGAARSHARTLLDRHKKLADQPNRNDFWELRKLVTGARRWIDQVRRQAGPDRGGELDLGLIQLEAACRQSLSTITDVRHLFENQATQGTGSIRRRHPDAPPKPRVFTARFGGTCTLCRQRIHQGTAARYTGENQLAHVECTPS